VSANHVVISYEVQLYMNGKWRIDSLFDDQHLAETEAARAMDSTFRPQAVRVVLQLLDEKTQLISERTVFRRSRVEEQNAREMAEAPQRPAAEPEPQKARKEYIRKTPVGRPLTTPHSRASWLWLTAVFVMLAIGGIGTLVGLEYLSKML
jgi:hypothetical protein